MTRSLHRFIRLAGVGGSLLAALAGHPLLAQRPDTAFVPPVAGSWEPIHSLGQPRSWKPFAGLSLGAGRENGQDVNAYGGYFGVYRDLGRPIKGLLGWQAEGYAGSTGGKLDGGGRFLLRSPLLFLGGGVDYNLRLEDVRGIVSLIFPPARGGMFTRGGQIRLDWLPGDENLVLAGLTFPIAQPRIGVTRPKAVEATVPEGGDGRDGRDGRDGQDGQDGQERAIRDSLVQQEIEGLGSAARRVTRLSFLFWGLESGSSTQDVVRATESAVRDLKVELQERDSLKLGTGPHEREVLLYHESLERAFGLARGMTDSAAALEEGRVIAEQARRFVLQEVFYPYNRLAGQYKSPDTIEGFAARARTRFAAWLALECPGPTDASVLEVFDEWVDMLESIRESLSDLTEDSRQNWLPMALALRPEQHRTQAQIDALLADALGASFSRGNALLYFTAQQFQVELNRSIHEAERYHVLWIHDYRGVDESGHPDRVGYYQTAHGYLAALTRRVREYDVTGRLPVYLLLLDQHYYDRNESRLWLDLLENPLGHRVKLPEDYSAMAQVIDAWQDSLAQAVRDSRRMQADADAFGRDWISRVVKVHVNITFPADFTFRTTRLLGVPFIGPDELMRDHRKVVIRDVTEADPMAGEVMLAGVGVGDNYTSATWEDRAVLLTGPVAAEFKAEVREVLRRNGLGESEVPMPLRAGPRSADWDEQVARLEAEGATARVLQARNRTGWGAKDATFVQMFLWDLVPPGTVIYVPDSLWTNALWLAQLVSAALRGCEVYVVAPALPNAPSDGFLQMSAARELITSLFVVARDLGDVIREGGGDLRVGLYTRRSPIGPPGAKLWEVDTTYAKYAFLRSQYPFPEETWQMLWAHRARLDSLELGQAGAPVDSEAPVPRMHRKTQFMASRELVHTLAAQAETHEALDLMMRGWEEGVTVTPEARPIPSQGRLAVTRRLFAGYAALPAALRDSSLLYFIAGSLNKDTRGMALDGEAIAVVSGEWSLVAWLDFWSLFGSTTWIERLEEIEALLPEQNWLQRWMSRRVRGLL